MTPKEAYDLAKRDGPSKILEDIIAIDSWYSYYYARDVIQCPFPDGESEIALNVRTSYFYARDILKGPFPAGEERIAKYSGHSFLYAFHVLKSPFPAGEEAIANMPAFSYEYAVKVLKAPFSKGEAVFLCFSYNAINLEYQFKFNRDICSTYTLARYPLYALGYAIMKDSRFPQGEPAMKASPRIWRRYQEFLNDTQGSL